LRRTPTTNTLFYGDNLHILREYIEDGSVDLVYLDPPFNSNATYNVLFKAPTGEQSQAQIEAFEDTWHWNEAAERAFDEVITGGGSGNSDLSLAPATSRRGRRGVASHAQGGRARRCPQAETLPPWRHEA
jgi:hypothetical protein